MMAVSESMGAGEQTPFLQNCSRRGTHAPKKGKSKFKVLRCFNGP